MPSVTPDLKGKIKKMENSLEDLEKGKDVSGNMVEINSIMKNMNPLMVKQTSHIQNFLQSQQHKSEAEKEGENRRYWTRVYELSMQDLKQFLKVSEQYFTLADKQSWLKISSDFEKSILGKKEQMEKFNIAQFLFLVINLKDRFYAHFLRSLLYRKCLLFKDIDAVSDDYVHGAKKQTTLLIQTYLTDLGYAPTLPLFPGVSASLKGRWSLSKQETSEVSPAEILGLFNAELEDMSNVIRNYANLSTEERQHQNINRNSYKIANFRSEIEEEHVRYRELQRKYREVISKDEKIDAIEMRDKLKKCQEVLQAKQNQIKQLKYQFRNSDKEISTLRHKIKDLEADLHRVGQQEIQKLAELESVQTSLNNEFHRLHKQIGNFSTMFEFESDGKKALAKEIQDRITAIQKLAQMLGREKNKNLDLRGQIVRLNETILHLGGELRKAMTS